MYIKVFNFILIGLQKKIKKRIVTGTEIKMSAILIQGLF